MHRFLAIGFALILAALPAAPAWALTEAGSHGWSRAELTLRTGPGPQYEVAGALPGKVAIKILRCQKLWCLVDGPGGRGWADKHYVDFGKDPHWPILDPDNDWPDLAGGRLCFYEGTNFTGRSFCAGSGEVFNDLATWGWDNRIRSIQVVEGTSAAICRDRFFQSYCERVYQSQPALAPFLQRQVSSIRVY